MSTDKTSSSITAQATGVALTQRLTHSGIGALLAATLISAGCGGEIPAAEEASGSGAPVGQKQSALINCVPSATQVAVFTDYNYYSSCSYLNPGVYPTASSFGLPNDSMTSVRVGSNAKVTLFRDGEFTGLSQTLTADAPYLGWLSIGNDTVSSLHVDLATTDCQHPPAGAVALFTGANFTGECVVRTASEWCSNFPWGAGYFPAMNCTGIANDAVSSIKFGSRTAIYMCRDWQLGGYCETQVSNLPYLGWLAIGDNAVSSFRVYQY